MLVNLPRAVEQRNWLDSLDRIAIILDGPLTVFEHPPWRKEARQSPFSLAHKQEQGSQGGWDVDRRPLDQ